MREHGGLVKKGTLGQHGDVEWWDDKVVEETETIKRADGAREQLLKVRRQETPEEKARREELERRNMDEGVRAVVAELATKRADVKSKEEHLRQWVQGKQDAPGWLTEEQRQRIAQAFEDKRSREGRQGSEE